MNKTIQTRYPLLDVLDTRWSPRAFDERAPEDHKLASLFEAARVAASCYNEQPWRFLVARREDAAAYEKLLSCLVEANQGWAAQAPVLGLGLAKTTFSMNGKPNAWARHDLGLASAQLNVQATAMNLYVHFMGGILPELARETFRIPDDYDIVSGYAIGYLGQPGSLPEDYRAAETGPRERRPLEELVFSGGWGARPDFV